MEQPDIVVSNNLKRLREERNLSYTQLAELTGVSKSMLRQIEIGDSSPTLNTLWKIANGLEIPFATLINPSSPRLSLSGFKDQAPILGPTDGYRLYSLITFDASRSFEIYYVEFDPGVTLISERHENYVDEIVMVIAGTLEAHVHDEILTVSADQILRFDATCDHSYHNPGNEVVRAIAVISHA